MLANSYAHRAYSGAGAAAKTERSGEYDTLARVTAQLKAASSGDDYKSHVAALDKNRRMWATISASVADEENRLPAELKASLFYLAEFTTEQTRRVLQNGDSSEPLIETNLAVMRGLNGVDQE